MSPLLASLLFLLLLAIVGPLVNYLINKSKLQKRLGLESQQPADEIPPTAAQQVYLNLENADYPPLRDVYMVKDGKVKKVLAAATPKKAEIFMTNLTALEEAQRLTAVEDEQFKEDMKYLRAVRQAAELGYVDE